MKILLIDDDKNLCRVVSYQLEREEQEVKTADTGKQGLRIFREGLFDVVVTDIQLPDLSGMRVLEEIRRTNAEIPIILITAFGTIESAVEACHLGADDYLTKPFGKEQLMFVISKALKLRSLQRENLFLKKELGDRYSFGKMVVHSKSMEKIVDMARQVAASDVSVLILGESGTGKGMLAKAIHFNSLRKDKPFITVNCPSIPENLLESELFGHVKGAFTGAIKDRKGKFELADGGTIFLDEIGDLSLNLQAKLLRVLQDQEFERVGDSNSIKVDVRLLSATNRNLEELVHLGKFREDLYYRLRVVPITIPPLRDRTEEIPLLADYFLKKYSSGQNKLISADSMKILQNYSWPGNIRELENVIQRLVVLSQGKTIAPADLPPELVRQRRNIQLNERHPETLEEAEKSVILEALDKSNGNRSQAARLLKIPRHVLLYRMQKYQIQ